MMGSWSMWPKTYCDGSESFETGRSVHRLQAPRTSVVSALMNSLNRRYIIVQINSPSLSRASLTHTHDDDEYVPPHLRIALSEEATHAPLTSDVLTQMERSERQSLETNASFKGHEDEDVDGWLTKKYRVRVGCSLGSAEQCRRAGSINLLDLFQGNFSCAMAPSPTPTTVKTTPLPFQSHLKLSQLYAKELFTFIDHQASQ